MVNVPDNFDFAEWEDERRSAYEARLPKCDCCGDPMEEWYEVSYKLQTWYFCKNCVTEGYYEE